MSNNLVDTIQEIARQSYRQQTPTDLLYGTVTATNPLGIRIDNRFEIGASHLVLSALCKPLIKYTEPSGEKVEIWRGLETGDRVRILECAGGQLFYVLDREGAY